VVIPSISFHLLLSIIYRQRHSIIFRTLGVRSTIYSILEDNNTTSRVVEVHNITYKGLHNTIFRVQVGYSTIFRALELHSIIFNSILCKDLGNTMAVLLLIISSLQVFNIIYNHLYQHTIYKLMVGSIIFRLTRARIIFLVQVHLHISNNLLLNIKPFKVSFLVRSLRSYWCRISFVNTLQ
jgi:hypothetical protein